MRCNDTPSVFLYIKLNITVQIGASPLKFGRITGNEDIPRGLGAAEPQKI